MSELGVKTNNQANQKKVAFESNETVLTETQEQALENILQKIQANLRLRACNDS